MGFFIPSGVHVHCATLNFYYYIAFYSVSIPLSDAASSCICSVGAAAACFHSRERVQFGLICLSRQNLCNRCTNTCGGGLEYSTVIWSILYAHLWSICVYTVTNLHCTQRNHHYYMRPPIIRKRALHMCECVRAPRSFSELGRH